MLTGIDTLSGTELEPQSDVEVPETVEVVLEQLFQGLQDKVRCFH